MAVRFIFAACAGLMLTACAATAPARQGEPGHPGAEALADLLMETARRDPGRIDSAQPEMAALTAALTGSAPDAEPAGEAARAPAIASPAWAPARSSPPPAPDLSRARSVMSAVHLASYRERRHAGPGWRALQGQAADLLAGLEPRLVEVDLGERGRFLRLKAGPLDSFEAARALCARLEAAGLWCAPSDFTGEALP